MAWDRRGYYYRSVRVGRRVVRVYHGCGEWAEMAATWYERGRDRREYFRWFLDHAQKSDRELDRMLDRLDRIADLAMRAAMAAAGYHRHKRGEWRKRRDQTRSEQADNADQVRLVW